jgi:prepilin peptidase CpaA
MTLISNAAFAPSIVFLLAAASLILLIAAAHDIAFRTIPNWMSALLVAIAAIVRISDGSLIPGLTGCLIILLCTGFCWRRGWLGGGDVKLLAACGLLVPPNLAVVMVLDVAVAGGALALLYLALGRVLAEPDASQPSGLLRRIWTSERTRICASGPLPYGSAIAVGTIIVLLKG